MSVPRNKCCAMKCHHSYETQIVLHISSVKGAAHKRCVGIASLFKPFKALKGGRMNQRLFQIKPGLHAESSTAQKLRTLGRVRGTMPASAMGALVKAVPTEVVQLSDHYKRAAPTPKASSLVDRLVEKFSPDR